MMRLRATRKSHAPACSNGFHHAVGLDELIEDLLQNVFHITLVQNPPADKIAQAALLPLDSLRDATVLLFGHEFEAQRVVHQ